MVQSGAAQQPQETLSIQPTPIDWLDSYLPGPAGGVTALTRIWRLGDTHRCTLCPVCTAIHERGVCQVQVRGPVDAARLCLLSLEDRLCITTPGGQSCIGEVLQGQSIREAGQVAT